MDDLLIIQRIADRADALYKRLGLTMPSSRIGLILDIEYTHEVNPIDLQGLLEADDRNFAHDISGILHNFNRDTFKLDNCWTPRYSKQIGSIDIDDLIGLAGGVIALLVMIAVLGLFEGPLS